MMTDKNKLLNEHSIIREEPPLIPEEPVKILTKLGLSSIKAKVYLALLIHQDSDAKSLCKQLKKPRQPVYQALSELQEDGLVEKTLAKPATFHAIPVQSTLQLLLKRKESEMAQLEKQAAAQFRNFEVDCQAAGGAAPSSAGFRLLAKNETDPSKSVYKLGRAVADSKKSVMCLTTARLFCQIRDLDEGVWRDAVKRGVQFKFIINGVEDMELRLHPELCSSRCFAVRFARSGQQACVLLVDGKEVFCRIGASLDSPVLWSDAPEFVALMRDYFETKWRMLGQR